MVHWSTDRWQTVHDSYTRDTGLGVHVLDIPDHEFTAAQQIDFTFYWQQSGQWEGTDYHIEISGSE
jgi:glucoamylase